MQIVINILEDLYEGIKRRDGALETEYVCDELMKAVDNGTPLPKGHDRLVEVKAVIKALFDHKTIYDVPTIIEADKVESEETE